VSEFLLSGIRFIPDMQPPRTVTRQADAYQPTGALARA
jgi:hypothetical protein